MATRSNIGIINSDTTITRVYCHNDGYPEGKVPNLDLYDTEEKVRELLSHGDISSLNVSVKDTFYYGRDRGEEGTGAEILLSEKGRTVSEEYLYLFDPKTGNWTCDTIHCYNYAELELFCKSKLFSHMVEEVITYKLK
jgi:hypothetical protein